MEVIKVVSILYFSSDAFAYWTFPKKSCIISVLLCKFKRACVFMTLEHWTRFLNTECCQQGCKCSVCSRYLWKYIWYFGLHFVRSNSICNDKDNSIMNVVLLYVDIFCLKKGTCIAFSRTLIEYVLSGGPCFESWLGNRLFSFTFFRGFRQFLKANTALVRLLAHGHFPIVLVSNSSDVTQVKIQAAPWAVPLTQPSKKLLFSRHVNLLT
jgi:hypothetical protein